MTLQRSVSRYYLYTISVSIKKVSLLASFRKVRKDSFSNKWLKKWFDADIRFIFGAKNSVEVIAEIGINYSSHFMSLINEN